MPLKLFEEITFDPRLARKPRAGEGVLALVELGGFHPERFARPRMSGSLDAITGFLGNLLGTGIDKVATLLADIIHLPTSLLTTGVDFVLLNFASIVGEIPVIGEFAALIVIALDAILDFVIELPELILRQVATLGAAIKTLSPAQKTSAFQVAMTLLKKSAPASVQPQILKAAASTPQKYGVNLGASVGEWLGALAAVAVPVGIKLAVG